MSRLTAATEPIETGSHGWTASNRPDFDRTFRTAARHSRTVRFLRIAVPTAVVGAALVLCLVTWLNPLRFLAALPTGSKLMLSGSKITMEQPRLAGYTRDSRAYELTAKTAAQDLAKPENLELKDILARMEMQDKAVV